jgi:hypothetical protein
MGHVALTRRGVRRRSAVLIAASAATAILGAIAITTSAGAASEREPGPGEPPAASGHGHVPGPRATGAHKVTICHATGSRTNPYVKITVDDDAIVREGHGGHGGPLFSPDLGVHEKWGDVIPPFDFGPDARYDGDNWSTEGRVLLGGDCKGGEDTDHNGPPGSKPDHPGNSKPPHTQPEHPQGPGTPGSTKPGNGHGGPKPSTTAPPSTAAAVKDASVTAPPTTAVSSSLPVTGVQAGGLVAVSMALLGSGIAVMVIRRRHTT